jgi:hypothetical protein
MSDIPPFNLRWLRAVKRSDLSSKAKAVANVLGIHYMTWDTGGDMRPGVPRLAKDTSMSERSVHRALKELGDAGYLKVGKRGHTGTATLYYGTFPAKRKGEDESSPRQAAAMTPAERPANVTTAESRVRTENAHDPPACGGDYVLPAGKYKGETIAQVFAEKPDYVTEFLVTTECRHALTRHEAQAFLNSLG